MVTGFRPALTPGFKGGGGETEEERIRRLFGDKYPFLLQYLPKKLELPPEEEKEPPWWATLVAPFAAFGAGIEEISKRAGMAVAAPFVPKLRQAIQPEDIFPFAPAAPVSPDFPRVSRAEKIYEELPGAVKFIAEETIFLPLWITGIGASKRAVEKLSVTILQRVESGLVKVSRNQMPSKLERQAMEAARRAGTGRKINEEALLREVYGVVRKPAILAPGQVAKLAGLPAGKQVLVHIPKILQKELGALGYTIGDMSKMTAKEAKDLGRRGVPKAPLFKPPPTAVPELAPEVLVKKLADFVRTMKPEQIKAAVSEAKSSVARTARVIKIQQKYKGEEAEKRVLAALAGKRVKAVPVEKKVIFTPEETNALKVMIDDSANLPPITTDAYIRLHTKTALNKLLGGEIPSERGLALLERVFGEEFVKAFQKTAGLGSKVWTAVLESMGLVKSLRASWDLSALYRQGAPLLTDRPRTIPGAVKTQIKAVFSDKMALDIHDAMHATAWEGKMSEALLYRPDFWSSLAKITTREEAYVSRFARHIPGIKRSERAYIVGLNKIRTDAFVHEADKWVKMGVKANNEDYRHLAKAINIMSGRGDIQGLGNALTGLNAVFFSPRFQLSRLMSPTLLIDKSPLVRKMAGRVFAKYFGFWATIFGGITYMNQDEVSTDLNPLSTNFGKVRIRDTWYDPLAGYAPWMRFVSRMMASPIYGVADSITEGKFKPMPPKVKSMWTGKIRDASLERLVYTLVRTKFSPAVTPVVDWMTGQTIIGEDVERMPFYPDQLIEYWSPLAIQAVIEGVKEEGWLGAGMAAPEFVGFGVYTIPVKDQLISEVSSRYTDYLDVRRKYNELKEEGKRTEARKYFREHPELQYGVEFGRTKRRMDDLRKRIEAVEDDKTLAKDEKQRKLEILSSRIISLAVRILEMEKTRTR